VSVFAPDGWTMSRRKQSKPQHINSDEPGSTENGPMADEQAEAEGLELKRCRVEETTVCGKCCAEFFDEAEFLEHQQSCTKSQEVVIMKNGGGDEIPSEFSHDLSSDFHNGHNGDGDESADPHSTSGAEDGEDEQEAKSSADEELSTHAQQAEMSSSSDVGYLPSAKRHRGSNNVTLESMPATKVAVTQHSSSSSNSSSSLVSCKSPSSSQDMVAAAAQALPMILEQLVNLQQQQLQQIQLTEQIRIQVAMMAPQALGAAAGALDPLKALGAHLSQQLSAAAALIGKRNGTQSLSLETLKQGKLPQINRPPASHTAGVGSLAGKNNILKGLPDLASQMTSLLPQSPGGLGFPGPFNALAAAGLDSSKKASGKIPGLSSSELKSESGEPSLRHKCKFCGKIFGNDSALQIHLRSHTGERPFKCNICGNRFTTKGNLKVHFQRHKEKYPHIKMNPHPVPEHLDNVPTSSGIPYGMSMPMEESNFVDAKPPGLGMSSSGFPSSVLPGYKPFMSNDSFSQRPSSSGSDGTSITSNNMFQQDIGMEQGHEPSESLVGLQQHVNGKMLGGGAMDGSLGMTKLQQMVEGLEKRTNDPNECVICHRILSCQSSLKMHYRTHTGERPYKCKICSRAFSSKGNLKAHYSVHRSNTPLKMQHSCPICQKKFTNAVVLQQHIRMHMGGQIPNTPVPQASQYDSAEPMDSSLTEDKSLMDSSGNNLEESLEEPHHSDMEPQVKAENALPEPSMAHHYPPSDVPRDGPAQMFTGIAALENHMKSLTAALNLQRQSSTASDSDCGGLKDSPSTSAALPEQDYKNGRSPAVSDSVSFHSSSPVDSQLGSSQSKSPESTSVDAAATSKNDSEGGQQDSSDGALDLTSSGFMPKAIKEEPGLPYSNGEFGAASMPYMRVPPSLVKLEMQIPPETSLGAHGLYQSAGIPSALSNANRRSTKQHLCNTCGKNFSSASALQIHDRTHTGEKPFACTICGRAFTTKGNLKVHVGTHMWNTTARRGQRLSLDNPMALMAMGSEAMMPPDMIPSPKDLVPPPPMSFDASVWNKYAAAFSNGLTMKTNEISVIQNGGIPLPGTLAGGPLMASPGSMMKMDGSQTGLPGSVAEMENNGSDTVAKAQFPHFMEEGKIAVN